MSGVTYVKPGAGSEQIWQNDRLGLVAALDRANLLMVDGRDVEAYAVRASAYYSFASGQSGFIGKLRALWFLWKAKQAARASMDAAKGNLEVLTADQCDILGTIALRGALWMTSDPIAALRFFYAGTSKPGPLHNRALLSIGAAEAYLLLGRKHQSIDCLVAAQMFMFDISVEPDIVLAMRQLCRIHRRMYVVRSRLNLGSAGESYSEALAIALDPVYGSVGLLVKLEECRRRIEEPRFFDRCIPL